MVRRGVHKHVLREVFGFEAYRQGQEQVVQAPLEGRDAVVLLPTGGGKSLCYQVPAIALARQKQALGLVISPLIALMGDQVRALQARGVRAAALNSHQSEQQAGQTYDALRAGAIELLYVSPERAALPSFRALLQRLSVGLIAVDEAHCVSQWGHDFRPEYLQLAELRELCAAPMIAATATATPDVLQEVIRHLKLRDPHIERGDFRRPNLSFSVEPLRAHTERIARLVELLSEARMRGRGGPGRAIVYCSTRKKSEEVGKALASQAFAAGVYHGGVERDERARMQRAFESRRLRVLVATSAFGMGIDIPDIRLIVHYQAPGSLEAYYQEAGRAGRDGEPARCVMFFGTSDLATQRRILSGPRASEAIRGIEHYANATRCRQQVICAHFGALHSADCGICDICKGERFEPDVPRKTETPTQRLGEKESAIILGAVDELTKPVGKVSLARALRGSRAKGLHKCGLMQISQHGALRHQDERAIVETIEHFIESGQLARKGHKYPTVWLPGKRVRQSADGRAQSSPKKQRRSGGFTPVVKALDAFRKRKARELGWKPYMVLQKRTIVALDAARPASLYDLQRIPGLGVAKIDRFGSELLTIVEKYG